MSSSTGNPKPPTSGKSTKPLFPSPTSKPPAAGQRIYILSYTVDSSLFDLTPWSGVDGVSSSLAAAQDEAKLFSEQASEAQVEHYGGEDEEEKKAYRDRWWTEEGRDEQGWFHVLSFSTRRMVLRVGEWCVK